MGTDNKDQGNKQGSKEQARHEDKHSKRREMRIVEEGVKTLYSSTYNIFLGPDEVMFAFGNRSLDPNVMRIESKIAVSIKTAKRMAITLGDLIRRYEVHNGRMEISLNKSESDESTDNEKLSPDGMIKTH